MVAQSLAPAVGMKAVLLAALSALLAAAVGDQVRDTAPWRIIIAPPEEPGEPLVVTGTVYGPDGSTPAPGVTLRLHHTDARGYYSEDGKNEQEPRLHGRLTTDARGRYEFRTIKPAPYPGGRNPAHIHVRTSGGGFPEQWPHEFWFEGDRALTARLLSPFYRKGPFSPVCPSRKDGTGVIRCTRDIRLKSK